MAGVASAAPLPAVPASNPAARSAPSFLPLRARRPRGLATGGRRTFRAEAIRTQREKAEQETEEGAAAADDPLLAPADEVDGWVVTFEQQFNIFLTIACMMYSSIYETMRRSIARQ